MMFETEDRTDGRGKYLRLPMVENMFLNPCYIEQKIEHEKLKEEAEYIKGQVSAFAYLGFRLESMQTLGTS